MSEDGRQFDLKRRAAAEGVGTALLLATVVGSGIMGERLAGGNAALALLANTIATGAGLVCLILTFGPVSGAHFNPAVTLARGDRQLRGRKAGGRARLRLRATLRRGGGDPFLPLARPRAPRVGRRSRRPTRRRFTG